MFGTLLKLNWNLFGCKKFWLLGVFGSAVFAMMVFMHKKRGAFLLLFKVLSCGGSIT
jgi:hypothetical protein